MKRIVSLILAIVLTVGCVPLTCFAAQESYMDVSVDGAPIREDDNGDAPVVYRCEKGTTLRIVGSTYNRYLHKWYVVEINGEKCYIYSDNVERHIHCYREITVNGVVFTVCNCGHIEAKASTKEEQKKADEAARSLSDSLVLAAPFIDGPLPVGDVIAAGLVALGVYYAADLAIPAVEDLVGLITEVDFTDYLEKRSESQCPEHCYRRVKRWSGGLKYVDNYCMDMVEAYLYVRILQKDIYTVKEEDALMLAAMHTLSAGRGSAVMERDQGKAEKDLDTYYYHYHLGDSQYTLDDKRREHLEGAHIFFGVNDKGEYPS